MKKLASLLVLAGIFLLVACSSDAENNNNVAEDPVEIELATPYDEGSPDVAAAEKFSKLVEEESDGEIKVDIFANGTLGSETDNFTELSNDSLDMVIGGTPGIEKFAPGYTFSAVPFLIKDMDHLEAWFESDLHEEMVETMKESNIHFLGDIVRGARNTTADKPIESPEDYKGLKLRLPETPTLVKVFSELGAEPTTVELTELYSSLQTGVVDASEGPYEQIATNQLNEVQDYISNTEHIIDVSEFWISEKLYSSLNKEHKKIIEEAGEEAAKYGTDLALDSQEEYLEKLEESDIEIVDLTEEEQKKLEKEARPAIKKLFDEELTSTTYEEFMNLDD